MDLAQLRADVTAEVGNLIKQFETDVHTVLAKIDHAVPKPSDPATQPGASNATPPTSG